MYQMMNFCKVSSLVCAASDGEKIKRYGKEKAGLRKRELEFANEEGRPSFVDYWAYLYFCGGAISGPWFEFRDFQDYLRGRKQYAKIPSTVRPALTRILHLFLGIGIQSILSNLFNREYFLSDDFSRASIPMKFYNLVGYTFLRIATYVCGFCLMETGPLASGLSFNGYDKDNRPLHNRVTCIKISSLIFTYRIKDFVTGWNVSVHHWLKYYVFMRQLDSKTRSTVVPGLVTFVVSAIWHGFYPGYLWFFVSVFFMDNISKVGEPVVRPLFSWCPDLV
jgi:lysophospholipid acyltransferase